ncbi:MAG: hypothetical protein KGI54_15970 [Pseudomonadota bacterium]|nr:hypothetical protein [Pseudomonadota bacterium]
MTNFVFANNVQTKLAAAAATGVTTLTLSSSANLPTLSVGEIMPLTLNDAATGQIYEIVYVTAISGVTLTVERGQEGTSQQNWAIGDNAFSTGTAATTGTSSGNPSTPFQLLPNILNQSVAGGVDVTLSNISYANEIINLTGAITANINVIVPAVAGLWTFKNGTTGAFTLTVKTTSGTGVVLTQGYTAILYCDGTNVINAYNFVPMINLPVSDSASGFGIAAMKLYAGNPNGNVAGNANVNGASDLVWDTTNSILYICTTTGTASTAVWTQASVSLSQILGISQTWSDQTANRSSGVIYTNSGTKPIIVSVNAYTMSTPAPPTPGYLYVNGLIVGYSVATYEGSQIDQFNSRGQVTALVPPGQTYEFVNGTNGAIISWLELS